MPLGSAAGRAPETRLARTRAGPVPEGNRPTALFPRSLRARGSGPGLANRRPAAPELWPAGQWAGSERPMGREDANPASDPVSLQGLRNDGRVAGPEGSKGLRPSPRSSIPYGLKPQASGSIEGERMEGKNTYLLSVGFLGFYFSA